MCRERSYRNWVKSGDLVSFRVAEAETDLFISAEKKLESQARAAILNHRKELESYIEKDPEFYSSLEPVDAKKAAPDIAKSMILASKCAGTGPMAAVAGAIAEFTGRDLLKFSNQVIVENGGDIFMKTARPRTVGIYAGEDSPFTGKLAVEIQPSERGVGVCTSSGTVSHSLSFGKADAVLVISDEAALADAAATAAGNIVKDAGDIEKGISFAKSIPGVRGGLVVVGDKLGSWGEIKIV